MSLCSLYCEIIGQGNIEDGSAAEFNFHCDPEAAYMVLHELSCPIIAFSWEAVLKHHYSWVRIVFDTKSNANIVKVCDTISNSQIHVPSMHRQFRSESGLEYLMAYHTKRQNETFCPLPVQRP